MIATHRNSARAVRGASVILAVILLLAAMGCGSAVVDSVAAAPLVVADGDVIAAAEVSIAEVIVLDWTGGTSQIYPNVTLAPFDFAAFPTTEGKTLADSKGLFEEAVRQEVVTILSELPDVRIVVQNGEATPGEDETVVHIAQELPLSTRADIGEGEYDPCNTQADNAAIIYAQRLRDLGAAYPVEEWVRVIANVTAHEIGHTLGFGHVSRSEHPPTPGDTFVEIMLDGHTFSEMRQLQRFIEPQSNCEADDPLEGSRIVVAAQAE